VSDGGPPARSAAPPRVAPSGETTAVEVSLWRALAVFRLLTLAYAVVANLLDLRNVAGPGWLLATLALMTAWSVGSIWLYARVDRRRRTAVLVADMVGTLLVIGATILVESQERIAAGEPTVPMVWSAGVVLAWAVAWGIPGGLAAAALVNLANLVQRGSTADIAVNNIVLLVLAGAVVGYVAALANRAERVLAEGVRLQAATAERERLSRQIHDGVLQVLALVQRRGAGLGGEAAELGRLAGEQETALRALMVASLTAPRADGQVDLRGLLGGTPQVHLSAPASPVLLPADVAAEIAAAVGEALHNVAVHIGPDAPAWLLVEDTEKEIVVTVRDDGPGMPPGRLAEAAAEGRLGVAQSVVGRVRDLGGTVAVVSAPGEGTEVELRVPRTG
jgi:signal transduction histidine kinase